MSEKIVSRYGNYKLTLYIPEEYEELVKTYIAWCKAQGTTASREILDFVKTQVPEQEKVKEDPKACFKCQVVSDQLYLFRAASGRRLWACEEHFKFYEEKGLVRTVLKRPELFNPNLSFAPRRDG